MNNKRDDRIAMIAIAAILAVFLVLAYVVFSVLQSRETRIITQSQLIPFQTNTNNDCSLMQGVRQISTKGVNGIKTIKYKKTYILGKEISSYVISDKTTANPVGEKINIGENTPKPQSDNVQALLAYDMTYCGQQANLECDLNQSLPYTYGLPYQQTISLIKQGANKLGCPVPSFLTPTLGSASDSSGYDAGYQYAADNQICDPSYDSGDSQDFNDGVNAWTADNCTDGQPN